MKYTGLEHCTEGLLHLKSCLTSPPCTATCINDQEGKLYKALSLVPPSAGDCCGEIDDEVVARNGAVCKLRFVHPVIALMPPLDLKFEFETCRL